MSGPSLSNDAATLAMKNRSRNQVVLISMCGFLRVRCEILPTFPKAGGECALACASESAYTSAGVAFLSTAAPRRGILPGPGQQPSPKPFPEV